MAATEQQQQQPQEPAAIGEAEEALLIKDLLKTLGVQQYDPRVVDALTDLTYRATSDILQHAEAIAVAAGGSASDLSPQDIALAAAQHARLQPQPPSMQELHALARKVNAQPLTGPSDKQHGIKLPPVADCLLSQNYQLKPRPRRQAPQPPAAAAGVQPPRQHYAVSQPGKRQGKMSLAKVPQEGWQPQADTADAQPFPQPAHGAGGGDAAATAAGAAGAGQQAGGPAGPAGQEGAQGMEVDEEQI